MRLLAAKAEDSTGQWFTIQNSGQPVISSLVNRGHVVKEGYVYKLIYDNFGQTEIRKTTSYDKFNFPTGTLILTPSTSTWENVSTGLPSYLLVGAEERVY